MRKLAVSDYTVKARNEKGEQVDAPYSVKESLIGLLFHPMLKLGSRELLVRDKLADKINDSTDGFILLEDAEWKKLEAAVDTITGYGKAEVELVKRVLEAEVVQVEEKKLKD